MRVFTILTIVFDAAVLDRCHVPVRLADLDYEICIRVDHIVLAVVGVAPRCEDSSRRKKKSSDSR